MDAPTPPKLLHRYTDLPALLHILKHKKITLLDPKSWDDTNDRHYLEQYKQRKGLGSVLALCLTEASETIHHWKIFSPGSSGICITFKGPLLCSALQSVAGIKHGRVRYVRLRGARSETAQLRVDDLPFRKRFGFRAEEEYRAIFESPTTAADYQDVSIEIDCIDSVTLSPFLAKPLSSTITETLRSIPGCEGLKVHRSGLVGNTEWKALADNAVLSQTANS